MESGFILTPEQQMTRKILRAARVADEDVARVLSLVRPADASAVRDYEDSPCATTRIDVRALQSRSLSSAAALRLPDTAILNARAMFELAAQKVVFLILLAGTGCIGTYDCGPPLLRSI